MGRWALLLGIGDQRARLASPSRSGACTAASLSLRDGRREQLRQLLGQIFGTSDVEKLALGVVSFGLIGQLPTVRRVRISHHELPSYATHSTKCLATAARLRRSAYIGHTITSARRRRRVPPHAFASQ